MAVTEIVNHVFAVAQVGQRHDLHVDEAIHLSRDVPRMVDANAVMVGQDDDLSTLLSLKLVRPLRLPSTGTRGRTTRRQAFGAKCVNGFLAFHEKYLRNMNVTLWPVIKADR